MASERVGELIHMDDIFYLSQRKLDVDTVYTAFQKAGTIQIEKFKLSNTLLLYTKTQVIHLAFMEPFEFGDDADLKFIQSKNIASILCISHHTSYMVETIALAKFLLEKWGGWIGNDTDGFLPVFDIKNIALFHHTDHATGC